ncbi:protein of unknown function [Taphrina deformans PYCC 5710]|uniref:Exocyst complex component EXO84 n=1 Tax=Taphrina deformans (strain PYCC 5710 / ATCC 11124 / CBS 356.35 / IMI 108563 / JCM 9778 / NBRC 8474) TaxID=1097556 RepID=R4XKS6_TAPDE|nr:protein of unknown function [Taphrina deformans PYCC 5710]|eukprot:CCG83919.1 protein of unknown function [Taphrina deformans PYCC 5710]
MSSAAGMLPTLRKKKTRKDLPRRISTYNGGPVEISAKDKTKVQDRIKKRLSTKIGTPMLQTSSHMPLPSNALQNINAANRIHIPREPQATVTSKSQGTRPSYDPNVFNDPDFNAESYVKEMLATATPAELDSFFQSLQDSKDSTNTALQNNVYHNYREFISVSKEISTLESDMASIRGLLNDLRGITTSLQNDSTVVEEDVSRSAGRRGARNSIIDFNQLNKTHLKALWTQVEGAQKFLPADEGRRIVRESGAWVELNAATWRAKDKVHMVLLNDHLLLAVKKHKPGGTGQRLVAQRCFPLPEIKMRLFQDEEMQSAVSISVIANKEKFVFKADSQDEKQAMYLAFNREVAELQAVQQRDDKGDKRLTGSHDTSRDSRIKRLSRRLSKNPGLQRNGSISQAGKDSNETIDLTWVQERMDDLDQRIAHREYREAVRSVLRGRALVSAAGSEDLAADLTALRLDERTDRLAGMLCDELGDESYKSKVVKELVSYLVAIDRTDAARDTFLAARSALIRKRARGVMFEGDLSLYIADLALVHFTLIRNTTTIYRTSFTSPSEMSGLVAWAKTEVEAFVDLFVRQLYGNETDSVVYRDALDAVSKQIAVLRDVGLDFAFVVESALAR